MRGGECWAPVGVAEMTVSFYPTPCSGGTMISFPGSFGEVKGRGSWAPGSFPLATVINCTESAHKRTHVYSLTTLCGSKSKGLCSL